MILIQTKPHARRELFLEVAGKRAFRVPQLDGQAHRIFKVARLEEQGSFHEVLPSRRRRTGSQRISKALSPLFTLTSMGAAGGVSQETFTRFESGPGIYTHCRPR